MRNAGVARANRGETATLLGRIEIVSSNEKAVQSSRSGVAYSDTFIAFKTARGRARGRDTGGRL